MTNEYIDEQMYLLAKHINIGFDNIDWLKKAMNSTPLPKRPDDGKNKITDCENTALATVGDAILKAILSDYFYETGASDVRKGDITKKKELLEKNDTLFEVMKVADLKQFTYNNYGFYNEIDSRYTNQKVSDGKHNQYIEAIIAAIYYDQGFDSAKKWVIEYLLPMLEQCAHCR